MSSLDRLKRNLASFVQGVMRPVDYFALYPAKVVQQDASSLLLEVTPDDPRLPGMQKVPMRLGIPNATAKIAANARGLVGFEGGDPSKPFFGPWESASLTELNIGGATQFAALANLVLDMGNSIRNTVNANHITLITHTHNVTMIGAPSGPMVGGTQTDIPALQSVACEKVKVK